MKLEISTKNACTAALVALVARTFVGLMVDGDYVHNGAWISALLGGIASIPWLLCLVRLRNLRMDHRKVHALPLSLSLLAALIMDASQMLSAIVRSACYLTLTSGNAVILLLPTCIAVFWCVTRGGNAVGYSAALWIRLFPLFMIAIVVLQLGHYQTAWLSPLLGPGWREIIYGGARTAEWIMIVSSLLLIPSEHAGEKTRGTILIRTLVIAEGVLTLLITLRLMMTPTMLKGSETWLKRLDSLIVNGRAPLYLQLPMIVLWFAGLLHLLMCECFTAAALLQQLLPRIDGRACAGMTISVIAALSRYVGSGGSLETYLHSIAVILPLCAAFTIVSLSHHRRGIFHDAHVNNAAHAGSKHCPQRL